MSKYEWLIFAVLAGLCWGTYVPFVQQGIRDLGRNAYGSFLCVGVAYFLIAVLFPIGMFVAGERQPSWNVSGISFATLAGVAGALGALMVIFANRSAAHYAAQVQDVTTDYRMYIGPVIFALAPLLNTIVSLLWHPSKGAFHFGLEASPGWKFYAGIVLTGLGTALVLYSKEEVEHNKPKAAPVTHTAAVGEPKTPAPQ